MQTRPGKNLKVLPVFFLILLASFTSTERYLYSYPTFSSSKARLREVECPGLPASKCAGIDINMPNYCSRSKKIGGLFFDAHKPELTALLEEMRKTNKYAQLFDRQVAPEYQHDMDTQTAIVTMGARIMKNYRPVIGGLSGQAHAATYYMLGAYSYLIELWGSPAFDADADGDGRVSDEEYLKWIDIELAGEGWISPHKCQHPDLGEIWIGGTRKKHTQRTPPARYIEMEALKNAQFVMYCASQFPKVEIERLTITPATHDLLWVEARVANDRLYPTLSDRALQLKRAAKDTITLKTSNNISQVELPEGSTMADPRNPVALSTTITTKGTEFRLKGKETLRFCALVKMNGSQGWVEVHIASTHGGTANKRVIIER